ncbi:MAG TPA: hypothetical protein VN805_05210 [Caulobacteraceae bacterium]|nr:hypothetical protein [Caulobacteraceae bacterium]
MARNSDVNALNRTRERLFVGVCVAIFLVIAACAIYAVVRLAV